MARLTAAAAGAEPGAVQTFAMAAPPRGWLKCNGAEVARADYPRLFAAIGETHGAGDGATTFNLPDLRGEFVRGLDDGRGVDSGRGLGSSQGDDNKSHSHSASTNSTGSHGHSGSTNSTGSHSHSYTGQNANDGNLNNGSWAGGDNAAKTTGAAGNHWHSLSINGNGNHSHSVSVGNSGGSETRPRNVAMLYAIKT
ncbi:tail fiber protein [Halomonas sp. NO4]|uniref:tail fiber protein n=1 Tax=Halomonas sp. NO4 TaxID=2484813 RepID=UPI0013D1A507|nr:tail fiber protein [Halomonas sp. NO4]